MRTTVPPSCFYSPRFNAPKIFISSSRGPILSSFIKSLILSLSQLLHKITFSPFSSHPRMRKSIFYFSVPTKSFLVLSEFRLLNAHWLLLMFLHEVFQSFSNKVSKQKRWLWNTFDSTCLDSRKETEKNHLMSNNFEDHASLLIEKSNSSAHLIWWPPNHFLR